MGIFHGKMVVGSMVVFKEFSGSGSGMGRIALRRTNDTQHCFLSMMVYNLWRCPGRIAVVYCSHLKDRECTT